MENPALEKIAKTIKNWWVPLVIGILLILLSIYVFQHPIANFVALAMFFSIMLILSGIASMAFAWVNRQAMHGWGWNFGGGVLEAILGFFLLSRPGITMVILTFLLGFWLLFRGAYLVSMAFEMKDYQLPNWGWVLTGGVLTTILAIMVIFKPAVGAIAISVWIGLGLLMSGIFTVVVALMLRRVKHAAIDVRDRVKEKFEED